LYLLFGISSRPPREFSLTSAGTKKPGQVSRGASGDSELSSLAPGPRQVNSDNLGLLTMPLQLHPFC
jgi:hypothetical protein